LQPGVLRDLGPASSKSLVGVRDVMLQRMVMDLLAEPEVFLKHLKDVVDSRKPSEPVEFHFRTAAC
jgi:hypothetical protein